jgi:hypothetical protein
MNAPTPNPDREMLTRIVDALFDACSRLDSLAIHLRDTQPATAQAVDDIARRAMDELASALVAHPSNQPQPEKTQQ